MALPKASTTKNKTCWVTSPACIGSVTSPSVMVVVSLKSKRIRPVDFSIPEETFILLKLVAATSIPRCKIYLHAVHIKTANT